MYYTIRALQGAEEKYPSMEKLAFTLVTTTHTVVVLTDKSLRRVMSNPKAAGRMALWAIELSKFDIQYHPRTTIKGQVVIDFIVEFTSDDAKNQ